MYEPKNFLVTGGAGFIASHIVLDLLRAYPNAKVVNLDKLDRCSSLYYFTPEYIQSRETSNVEHKLTCDRAGHARGCDACADAQPDASSSTADALFKNYKFIKGDILSVDLLHFVLEEYQIDTVLHFAANTHVDLSFGNSFDFTTNNVMGTHVLLECVRQYGKVRRFIHVSTDEVYGETAYQNQTTETGLLKPTNPYAASKASAESMANSYIKSFKLPIIIVRCNNVFGPHQFPEKLIPKFILRLSQGLSCCIHGQGQTRRSYIYIDDVVTAYRTILEKGVLGEIYNIEAGEELTVMDVTKRLLCALFVGNTEMADWPEDERQAAEEALFKLKIEYVCDRAFNDQRYHIDGSKLKALGFCEKWTFEQGLKATIAWYKQHQPKNVWKEEVLDSAIRPHS